MEAIKIRWWEVEGRQCDSLNHQKGEGVNPLETIAEQPIGSKKELSHRMFPEVDGLFEAIKEFLESNGVELYRMQVEQEAYQVKHKGQIIRLYVHKEEHGKGKEKQ